MYIQDQLGEIRNAIAGAAERVGRAAESITLLAVSKTFPVSDIMQAYADRQRIFGENRLQEAMEKMPRMPQDCEWHLIGPHSNATRYERRWNRALRSFRLLIP